MAYAGLANAVALLHLAFVAFVTIGAFAVLRWPRLAWIHLPAAVWGILIEFGGWLCPLTPLENWLRRKSGASGFSGGFVEHYLFAALYPEGLSRNAQYLLGALVLAINVAIYWRVFGKKG